MRNELISEYRESVASGPSQYVDSEEDVIEPIGNHPEQPREYEPLPVVLLRGIWTGLHHTRLLYNYITIVLFDDSVA